MPRTRLVVLISGSGTLLQALLDASADPHYPAEVVGVLADSPDAAGLQRARSAGVPAMPVALAGYPDRAAWDDALRDALESFEPDWVVSAGFMRILGPGVLSAFPMRVVNTHPALLPSFPGAHAVRDALAHGVRVTGSTIHLVDEGVDTGPIVDQRPSRSTTTMTRPRCTSGSRSWSASCSSTSSAGWPPTTCTSPAGR